ncbi:MAG: exonuclease subunit SbcD [Weeksellaceae bacterium]|nr:exonuclease subunit SbcD [Weeksellaceae bacterium]
MRILHTADWHLGKKLYHIDRITEQAAVLEEICTIAETKEVDVVLIAGDLYDVINPGSEANELFYKTLRRLSANGTRPVVAISGNHDSADRIAAPDPLAKVSGILLFGHPETHMTPNAMENDWHISQSAPGFIELSFAQHPPLRIITTPYVSELRVGKYMGENEEEMLREYVENRWSQLATEFCDDAGCNVLMTHLFMWPQDQKPPEEPEGEKPIKIGNASIIYTHLVPEQMQYVALGHLHRSQKLSGSPVDIRYSGSPLAYSFSEAGQDKYVHIVDLHPGQSAVVEKVKLNTGMPLLRKSFDNIADAQNWIENHTNSHLEVSISTSTALSAAEVRALQSAGTGLVQIIPRAISQKQEAEEIQENQAEKSLQDVFRDYFRTRQGVEPSEEIMNLLNEILSHNHNDA